MKEAPPLRMLFRWASLDGHGIHSTMPTVAQCEADGYESLGPRDPRYPSVLMRKILGDDE